MKPVADPERPYQRAYVEQVFLVGESEWEQFPMPQHIRGLPDRQDRTPADTLSPD
jgi:hypothetical protein